eukprot:augustus_masked-scaffold_1-processed-gene-25.66-mRNA-1 protein AED:0.46 eAED:0.56 QI:0/0/0/0.5/1/1/2/0/1192
MKRLLSLNTNWKVTYKTNFFHSLETKRKASSTPVSTSTGASTQHLETGDPIRTVLSALALFGSASVCGYAIYRSQSSKEDTTPGDLIQVREEPTSLFNILTGMSRRKKWSTTAIHNSTKLNMQPRSVAETVTLEQLRDRYTFNAEKMSDVKDVLGVGAYGKVFKGIENLTGKSVAIKVVSHDSMSANDLFEEVHVLRRVKGHDHIIHVSEVLNCDGNYFIISELCEDGELINVLEKHGIYPTNSRVVDGEEKLSYAGELVKNMNSALQHIHNSGYSHSDLKPENIVFCDESHVGDGHPTDSTKLDQFTDKLGDIKRSTVEKSVGTLVYSPPEVLQTLRKGKAKSRMNLSDYDPRKIDLWALGIVLYIILYGCHPFDSEATGCERKIIRNILADNYYLTFPDKYMKGGKKLGSHVPPEAKDLIRKLLQPDPKKRISSVEVQKHPFVVGAMKENSKLSSDSGGNFHKLKRRLSKLINRFKTSENKEAPSLEEVFDKLPNSWVHPLQSDPRLRNLHRLLEKEPKGMSSFQKDYVIDTFVRALLLVTLANALNYGSEGGSMDMTCETFLKQAFNLIDKDSTGLLSLENIKSLHNSTSEAHDRKELLPGDKDKIINFEEFECLLLRNGCYFRTIFSNEDHNYVYSKGDEPEGFFIITKGISALKHGVEGETEQAFSRVCAGSVVGETALRDGLSKRAATLEVLQDADVTFIHKELFFRALAASPGLKSKVFEAARVQQSKRLKNLIDYLLKKHYGDNNSPYIHGKFKQGEVVYREGEYSKYLYFIRSGLFGAYIMPRTEETFAGETMGAVLGERGPGDFTGSTVFHHNSRHYCGCAALEDTECLMLEKKVVDDLIKKNDLLLFYLSAQSRWRKEMWNESVAGLEQNVAEPKLLSYMLGEKMSKESKHSEVDEGPASTDLFIQALAASRKKKYAAGEPIFKKGEPVTHFYFMKSGSAFVEASSEEEGAIKLAFFGPGDHFGDQALMNKRNKHSVTVRCKIDCEVLMLEKHKFFELLNSDDAEFSNAIKKTSRFRKHNWGRNLLNLANDNEKSEQFALKKGDILYSQNDRSNSVYYIHSGKLASVQDTDKVVEKGDTLCLLSGLGFDQDERRQHTMKVISDEAVITRIPSEGVEHLIGGNEYISETLKSYSSTMNPFYEVENSVSNLVNKTEDSTKQIDGFKRNMTVSGVLRPSSIAKM